MESMEIRRAEVQALRPGWQPMTLAGFLKTAAGQFGDRPLVIGEDGKHLTYATVQAHARQLADGLAALGVEPGDRVGMVMANHPEFAALKFAIARVAAVAIFFTFFYRSQELAYVLRQSRCHVLVTMDGFGDSDYLSMLDSIIPNWRSGLTDELPDLGAMVVRPSEGGPADLITLEDLAELGRREPGGADPAAGDPDDLGEMLCVPTMTVALLDATDRPDHDLSSLGARLSGVAPASTWVWNRVAEELGVEEVTTSYGMTECGGAMTLTLPEDPPELHSTTVGRPKMAGSAGIPDADGDLVSYATVDVISNERLEAGGTGELISTGPTHMLGFWEKPEQTAESLREGWVHSGDLGRVRDDGYLELTGRSKELYKSGGKLVMPKELRSC